MREKKLNFNFKMGIVTLGEFSMIFIMVMVSIDQHLVHFMKANGNME